MYRLQKSLHSSWTFSNSSRWILRTWMARIIWKDNISLGVTFQSVKKNSIKDVLKTTCFKLCIPDKNFEKKSLKCWSKLHGIHYKRTSAAAEEGTMLNCRIFIAYFGGCWGWISVATYKLIGLLWLCQERPLLLLLVLHKGLDVHVEAVAARTLRGLGGQLALLKQEGQQGKQGVPEHYIDQIMDNFMTLAYLYICLLSASNWAWSEGSEKWGGRWLEGSLSCTPGPRSAPAPRLATAAPSCEAVSSSPPSLGWVWPVCPPWPGPSKLCRGVTIARGPPPPPRWCISGASGGWEAAVTAGAESPGHGRGCGERARSARSQLIQLTTLHKFYQASERQWVSIFCHGSVNNS